MGKFSAFLSSVIFALAATLSSCDSAIADVSNPPFIAGKNIWRGENQFIPAGKDIIISPTGAGTVAIAPEGGGTIDNVDIGDTTPGAGTFTALAADEMQTPHAIIGAPGASSADAALDVFGTTNAIIHGHNTGAQSTTGGAAMIGYALPGAAMVSGNRLGAFVLGGSRDASNTTGNASAVSAFATENWTGTANGSNLVLETTAAGTLTRSAALTLGGDKTATFAGLAATQSIVNGHTALINDAGANQRKVQVLGIDANSSSIFTARFAANANGASAIYGKSRGATVGAHTIVSNNDIIGDLLFVGSDGVAFQTAARILASSDGTPAANDMPGKLTFLTTPAGSATAVERLRIDNLGNIGIGGSAATGVSLQVGKAMSGATSTTGIISRGVIQSDSTVGGTMFSTIASTQAASFTTGTLTHFLASQGTIGAGSAVTNQYGFRVSNNLIGATTNFGFRSDLPAGTGRWNFYASDTAPNFFAGDIQLGKTVTAGGTTGAQTINKTVFTVNFAAAATSLVVTNNLVTTSSITTCTVGTNDTTMKSVAAVAAAGSVTLHANAAPTAETRVNCNVFN